MDTIIGIDLGTSTTEAAVIKDGKAVMIFNFDESIITPSVVGLNAKGHYVVGEEAYAQLLLAPDKTVTEMKRQMGTSAVFTLGKVTHTPVELSTMLLSYVRSYASEYLKEDITHAVISVPAYFNDLQRQATVQAGKHAGFKVERIINEPTAAALSYGLNHMEEESHILVYDLGGGTFDVTLLEMYAGVLEVKASSGDNQLGGKDFDQCLITWLAERFFQTHGIRLEDNIYAMAKLKAQAELCKKELSTCESYEFKIPLLAEKDDVPLALEETITRLQFEEMITPYLNRTHKPIDIVLSDSEISADQLDMILLVGGSTRVPLVKKDIENYLGITPQMAVNPDYAVAEGAAIQGGILSGAISQEDSLIMTDVNPFTLGIRTLHEFDDDYMSVVIPRNVTIPVVKKEPYFTAFNGQSEAEIEVYQGESRTASHNNFLGTFTIGGIPYNKAGAESILVEFSYNQNGMLAVTASIPSTGEQASIEINMLEAPLTPERTIDVSDWKHAANAKAYRTVIRRVEKLIKTPLFVDEEHDLTREVEGLLYQLKKAIIEDSDEAEDLEAELLDLLDDYLD